MMCSPRMSSGATLTYLLILATLALCSTLGEDPLVNISQGQLRGVFSTSRKGRIFSAFRGIPYAAPPVGELRFKSPGPAPTWTGERLAKLDGSMCPQSMIVKSGFFGNEDCLFLNVYSPKVVENKKGLPVMVWIHGGGFHFGSGGDTLYGPELLMDRDIVLVTLNYRIGALGFLSLGGPELPGNFGLKDQVAALRWVKANIASFGGDPDLVTIFGESAGGACVQYLMLSPLSRGLFHRAIAQSGSAFNPWALTRHPRRDGLRFAKALGCGRENISDLIQCIHKLEPKNFVQLLVDELDRNSTKKIIFKPCVEDFMSGQEVFLPATPMQLTMRGEVEDVPFMSGLTNKEGVLQFFEALNIISEEEYLNKFHHLVPEELGLEVFSSEWNATWEKILNFYKGDNPQESFLNFISDVEFDIGVDNMVRKMAELKRNQVFYYQFSYDGGLAVIKKLSKINFKGTSHGDEVGYLFSNALQSLLLPLSEKDEHTVDRMTTLWTNFARTGNPTPDHGLGVIWEPVKITGKPEDTTMQYLDIGQELRMVRDDLHGTKVKFWYSLYMNTSSSIPFDKM